jgi:hypothetical protein
MMSRIQWVIQLSNEKLGETPLLLSHCVVVQCLGEESVFWPNVWSSPFKSDVPDITSSSKATVLYSLDTNFKINSLL